jgi:hypothetical protein
MTLVITEELMQALADERERRTERLLAIQDAQCVPSLRSRLAGVLVGAGIRIDRRAGRRALVAAAEGRAPYADDCGDRLQEPSESHYHIERPRKAA